MDMKSDDVFKVPADLKPLTEATAAKVGFRELTPTESDLVKECRDVGARIERLLKDITSSPSNTDGRWSSIARTHFQEGLMAAVRSITKPAFF